MIQTAYTCYCLHIKLQCTLQLPFLDIKTITSSVLTLSVNMREMHFLIRIITVSFSVPILHFTVHRLGSLDLETHTLRVNRNVCVMVVAVACVCVCVMVVAVCVCV